MDKSQKTLKPQRRRGSAIWQGLNRGTARFYAILGRSFLGRSLSCYRRINSGVDKAARYGAGHRCSPVSPARQRVMSAVSSSWLIRGLRALFGSLMDCPTACYGMFGMAYGICSVMFFFLGPYLSGGFVRGYGELLFSGLVVLLSFPLALSRRSFAESLGNSPLLRGIFVHFLGVPRDRLAAVDRTFSVEYSVLAYYISCVVGLLTAIATLFISPLIIPLVLLAAAFLGMLFTYPETGVVLFTLMLPFVWLDQRTLAAVVALVLLTWCSYGIKLLFLHRTMRLGLLDRVVLIFGGLIFVSGFTGYGVTPETIWQSICLTVCVSSYFLIVNLMTTRAHIRRCLVGVAASVIVVTALAYIRHIPLDSLLWLEGSRAGDAIIEGSRNAMARLSQLWMDHTELYLVLVFSWLYAYLIHTKRLFRKIMCGLVILLDLTLILMTNSVSALFCIAAVTVLFLLMLGHKWLSAGLIALPGVVCGGIWIQYLYPVSDGLQTILSRSRLYKTQLTESLWHMVLDHPAGIGVGDKAFATVYPAYAAPDLGGVTDCGNLFFEVVLGYGWAGLLLAAVLLLLFLQKSCTALRYTVVSKDRAMILGGVTSLVGMVIFGSVRSFITSPRVFFTVALVVALCSAYENVIFEERDTQRAQWASGADAEDRFYRSGDYKPHRTNASISQKE